MIPFPDIYPHLPSSEEPERRFSEMALALQEEVFFQFAHAKQERVRALAAFFAGLNRPPRVLLGSALQMVEFEWGGEKVELLDADFIARMAQAPCGDQLQKLEGAVLIFTNNDLSAGDAGAFLPQLIRLCPHTIFAGWDWDNHHWIQRSVFMAAHTDFYAPAHHENLYLLSRYNQNLIGPVYCGTQQWSREFLSSHLPEMIRTERSGLPLGKHVPYLAFPYRLRILQTLNPKIPTVGFTEQGFYHRTPLDRLNEWMSHKAHWIVPVLNDVPIRLFDALVTGGIPIVPDSLRFMYPVCNIPRDKIVFYGPEDILSPDSVVREAVSLFDSHSSLGIVDRHHFGLNHHHASSRLEHILKSVLEKCPSRSSVGA